MPPNADNPRGYYEHIDVVNLHDRLLLALNRSWDETAPFPAEWWRDALRLDPYRRQVLDALRRDFPSSTLWGMKDPRLCLLLPWWEAIWAAMNSRPLFVLVQRHPAEVAASLARREGMSPAKAALLWLRHTLQAENGTRGHARILVSFGDFLKDENLALAPISRALGIVPEGHPEKARLVDPTLGSTSSPLSTDKLPSWVEMADEALLAGGRGDETRMRSDLDFVARQLSAGESLLRPSDETEVGDLRRQLAMSRKQARWYEEEWQKATGRVENLKQRLERTKAIPLNDRPFSQKKD